MPLSFSTRALEGRVSDIIKSAGCDDIVKVFAENNGVVVRDTSLNKEYIVERTGFMNGEFTMKGAMCGNVVADGHVSEMGKKILAVTMH